MQKKITVLDLQKMKADNRKITMITAYDYSTARLVDMAGIDCVLVGDSLGMVVQGGEDTLSVTMEDMIYHGKCVHNGLQQAFLVVDMPFMSYQASVEQAVLNAGRLIKEGKAQAVKLEGGKAVLPQITAITQAGIPVVAHLGLTPQSVHALGGYKVQGRTESAQQQLWDDAVAVQQAGASMLVLEMVPAPLAERISKDLDIPTIGIGAGVGCDGQVLVLQDLLGMNLGFTPKFLKRYATLEMDIVRAIQQYIKEVQELEYPSAEHSFGMGKQDLLLRKLY